MLLSIGTKDCRLAVENERHRRLPVTSSLPPPPPPPLPPLLPKRNSLDRKTLKRTLKICEKDAEVYAALYS